MKRKTPIRHTVKSHTRQSKWVKSYQRGRGTYPRKSSRVVGRPSPPDVLEGIEKCEAYRPSFQPDFPYEELDPNIIPLVKTFHGLGIETFGSCQGHYFEGKWRSAFLTFSVTPEQVDWIKASLSDLEGVSVDVAVSNVPPYYALTIFPVDDYGYAIEFPENPKEVTDELISEITRRLREWKAGISVEEACRVGGIIGVDWRDFSPSQFRKGMEVELEHGTHDPQTNVSDDDLIITGKIAFAHMKEFPNYYELLAKMEEGAIK